MGNSDMIHDKWRAQARADANADDRFTVIWNNLVDAFIHAHQPGDRTIIYSYYAGMKRAYSLLTGDPEPVVHVQVMKAAGLPADAVAEAAKAMVA